MLSADPRSTRPCSTATLLHSTSLSQHSTDSAVSGASSVLQLTDAWNVLDKGDHHLGVANARARAAGKRTNEQRACVVGSPQPQQTCLNLTPYTSI